MLYYLLSNRDISFFHEMTYTTDMEQKEITITSIDQGKRLDKFLVNQLYDYSRSFLQSQIRKGEITVNNKKVATGIKLKKGDKIQIVLQKPQPISIEADKNILIDIIYENDDLLVINKESGIVVHPSKSTPNNTVVNALIAQYPNITSVGDDPIRPGIVHRLDKDVSGIMVVAKNQKTFEHLKTQFKSRDIRKTYIALAIGNISPPHGEIDSPIGRSKSNPNRMSVKKKSEGREAITRYKTVRKYRNFSLLEIETKTGRTHQIRVHLLSKGHPIVGDKIYFIKKTKKETQLNRIFLHASSIQFTDIKGNLMKFSVDLPGDLRQLLKQLT